MSLSYNIEYQKRLAEKLLKSYSDNPMFNATPRMLVEAVPKDSIKIDGKYYLRTITPVDGRRWDQPFMDRINTGDQSLREMKLKPAQRGRPKKTALVGRDVDTSEPITGGASKSGGGAAEDFITGAVKLLSMAIGGDSQFVSVISSFLSNIVGVASKVEISDAFQVSGSGAGKVARNAAVLAAVGAMMTSLKPVLNLSPALFTVAVKMTKDLVLQTLGSITPGQVKGAGIKSVAKKAAKTVKKAATSKIGRKVIGRVLDVAVPGAAAALGQTVGVPVPVGALSGKIARDIVKAKTGFGGSKFSVKMDGSGAKGKRPAPKEAGCCGGGKGDFGDKMKRRRALVNKIMKDKNIKFGAASKIVKDQKMDY